ncbi:hypothetical protein ABGB14_45520 [Nonomuraea sp. B10E15]
MTIPAPGATGTPAAPFDLARRLAGARDETFTAGTRRSAGMPPRAG